MTVITLALLVLAIVQGVKWLSDQMAIPTIRGGGAYLITLILGPLLAALFYALGVSGAESWADALWIGLGADAYAIGGYNGLSLLFGAVGKRVPGTPADPVVTIGGVK